MASLEVTRQDIKSQSRKRHKKGKLIKQGYSKSERDDARRVAARTFLSGIPLDSQHLSFFPASDISHRAQEIHSSVLQRPPSSTSRHSNTLQIDGINPLFTHVDQTPDRPHDVVTESPLKQYHLHQKHSPVRHSQSLVCDIESPAFNHREFVFTKPNTFSLADMDTSDRTQLSKHTPWQSFGNETMSVHAFNNIEQLSSTMVLDRRLVFTSGRGLPFAISSVISYKKEDERLKVEHPQRSRTRVDSMSLQLDLEVELATTNNDFEVSLGFLVLPVWVHQTTDLAPYPGAELTPPLPRKTSLRKLIADNTKRWSNPRPLKVFHQTKPYSYGTLFPSHDKFSPTDVMRNYHPTCLDNYDYFLGSQTTTIILEGKRVSIIQYTRPSDIEKEINEQFADVFPHIKLSLSKLRSIKREMHKVAEECEIELAAVAYSYVYFEKMVLMGKINKANRTIVAGACLLLAAKFHTDLKPRDVKLLVDKVADLFHISTRELLQYEFPVLVSLQFSLLTPNYQAQAHLDQLRDTELAQN